MNQLIAPRLLLIEALEERFAKYPDPEKTPVEWFAVPGRREKQLGVTVRRTKCFASPEPNIVFSHQDAFGYGNAAGGKKKMGKPRVTELPFWGRACDIVKIYEPVEGV